MPLFGGVKAFANIIRAIPLSDHDLGVEVSFCVQRSTGEVVLLPPYGSYTTVYIPIEYSDNLVTIELRVLLYLLQYTGELNLNVVFLP